MRFGLDVPVDGPYADPRLLAQLAGEAERAGWDGFFTQDVLSLPDPIADPWIALTAVVLATERMTVGSMLTPLPRRRPWEAARQAVTLDRLSGGRLVFGAGLGYAEHEFASFGDDPDPKVRGAARLDEALDIVAGAVECRAVLVRRRALPPRPGTAPARTGADPADPGLAGGRLATEATPAPRGSLGRRLPHDDQPGHR